MKKSIIASLLIACSLFIGGNTDARAEYPYDKPINIIVPFGPGGGVDIAARILADYFQQNYNITINVVNKPGGAQAIGINEMLRARPDGYTLAFPGFSALATTPKLTNVGYTLKNIKPVAHIASMECVLSTNKSSGIDTWEKFLQAAEKNPDGTVYGTTGSISTQRLYMTKLTDRFHGDLKIRHTAYTSGHEVSTALLGKHITALCQLRRLQRHRHLPQGTPRRSAQYANLPRTVRRQDDPRGREMDRSRRVARPRGVQQGQGRSHRRARTPHRKGHEGPRSHRKI